TPVLYGAGDFPLLALEHGRPREHITPLPAPAYPSRFTEDWQARDLRSKNDASAKAPRLFQQEQSVLLEMERDWRGGYAEERIRKTRLPSLQRVDKALAQHIAAGRPHAVSLAQEAFLGRKADPAIVALVDDVMSRAAKLEGKPGDTAKTRARLLA